MPKVRLLSATDAADTTLQATHAAPYGKAQRWTDFRVGVRLVLAIFLLLLLILVVWIFRVQTGSRRCDEGWSSFHGRKCFKVVMRNFSRENPLTFDNAQQTCGELASIHTAEENAFVHDLLRNSTRWESPEDFWLNAWIGLHAMHRASHWNWTDGTPVDFTMWSPAGSYPYKDPTSCAMVVA
ncbi:echinoidin-like isoform 2, partial [Aphelenchoides avenae]